VGAENRVVGAAEQLSWWKQANGWGK
jgi:hypothetical protein